ncbi:MAG: phasin family protein [Sphingomonas sp.]|uniref:phasin family protein n=1 Tax=Sphingomonas sp. TaxID=28214 RepID=UPI001AC7A375|nr:phasin family protein [Sphingomonas sp.]MBN8848245.1 phasin family protein [Sphingomonas sp.]
MTDTAAKPEPKPTAQVAPVAKPAPAAVAAKPAPVAASPAQPAPAQQAAAPVAPAAPVIIKEQTPAARRTVVKPVAKKPAIRAKAVASPKRPATKPVTNAAKEPKMAETFKTVTDKTQAYFADANQRAKGALEKGVKAFEDANAFHKGNIEALVESSKIAAKGAEKFGQDAAAYAKASYEKANEAFKAMSAVKSPTELFKLQSDYVRSSFDAFVAETSRSTEAALKLAGEIAQPLSNRFALAAEKVKAAA